MSLYGSEEKRKHYQRKDYQPNPINAMVVLEWDGKEKNNHVYLTNGSVTDPFEAFDSYDERSLIENSLFKEGKGPWNLLQYFPQRNEQGVLVHLPAPVSSVCQFHRYVYFTMSVMALTTAYRLYEKEEALQKQETSTSEPLSYMILGGEGIRRWHRQLKQENRDKLIVFVGESYGIFHIAEFMVLAGLRIKEIPPELGQPADILIRFRLGP